MNLDILFKLSLVVSLVTVIAGLLGRVFYKRKDLFNNLVAGWVSMISTVIGYAIIITLFVGSSSIVKKDPIGIGILLVISLLMLLLVLNSVRIVKYLSFRYYWLPTTNNLQQAHADKALAELDAMKHLEPTEETKALIEEVINKNRKEMLEEAKIILPRYAFRIFRKFDKKIGLKVEFNEKSPEDKPA